jgi:hypothetical protein
MVLKKNMKHRLNNKSYRALKRFLALSLFVALIFAGFPYLHPSKVSADTTSPRFAGNAATAGGGTTWTNPGNATGDTTSTAATSSMGNNTTTSQLILTNFGLTSSDIPADSVINGITIEVEWEGVHSAVTDSVIQLTSNGTSGIGSNLSAGTEQVAKGFRSYGGASNMWGTSLTQADLTSSNFGVIIQYAKGGGGTRTVSVYRARVIVNYTPPSITTYTLTTNVTGSGSISRNPDSLEYDENTEVTLTAIPDSGWVFVEWTGDLSGSTNPQNIIMNSNKTVTAVFQEEPPTTYTLTTNVTGSGSISRNPDSLEYDENTEVTLTAIPDSGWVFVEWTGDLSGSTNPQNIIMNSNKTVTAVFVERPGVLTSAATAILATQVTGNGSITSTGGENADVVGFVWDTISKTDPGNVSPDLQTEYTFYVTDTGNYAVGDFSLILSLLQPNTLYYYRAVARNSAGYRYGSEVTFTTEAEAVIDPVLTQQEYRVYNNVDALQPSIALAAQNQPVDFVSVGQVLRIRMNIKVSENELLASSKIFKLQYVQKSELSCANESSGSFIDVGTVDSGVIWRGYDNPAVTSGVEVSALLLSGSSVAQSYEELNVPSVLLNTIPENGAGEWDFVVQNNGAPPEATYCFRLIENNGTALNSYQSFPEITTIRGLTQLRYRWRNDDGVQ